MKKTKVIKTWPENDAPANFSDLCDEVETAILYAYRLRRKNLGKDIPVSGPDAPKTATCPSGSEMLTAQQLRFSQEDQCRNALTEIIGFAIRLGIEQGRRITLSNPEIKQARRVLKILKK
ncbi:MAG TPA: hypothetical protein VJH71_00875 [Candidatus Paceibacterota bacterium]